MTVRTRFAPSPTGYLHVGGLRTALYCYLMSKNLDGKFLLRIEDTDQERLVSGSVDNLIETLGWAGLNYDEGPIVGGPHAPYVQSERLPLYKKHVMELVKNGGAYHCFCSKEDIDAARERQKEFGLPPKYDGKCRKLSSKEVEEKLGNKEPFVIRQAIPASRTVDFIDVVRGRVKFESKDLEDQVLLKSDGFPTYHLAVVVDDHDMGITHTIRGEEWLPSTPKHILLYESFGWDVPMFVHLPLILNADRTKLSKRQNDVSTESYRQKGYLKEAIINFIALLGWNSGDNREIYSLEELVEVFTLDRVQKSGAIFDLAKLDWFNWQWRRRLFLDDLKIDAKKLDSSVEIDEYKPNHYNFKFASLHLEQQFVLLRGRKLIKLVEPHLSKSVLAAEHEQFLVKALLTVEEKLLQEPEHVMQFIDFYFDDRLSFDKDMFVHEKMKVDLEIAQNAVSASVAGLKPEDFVSAASLRERWVTIIAELGLKNGQVLWPCRVAMSNRQFSPGVFELAWALGYENTIDRLNQAVSYLGSVGK